MADGGVRFGPQTRNPKWIVVGVPALSGSSVTLSLTAWGCVPEAQAGKPAQMPSVRQSSSSWGPLVHGRRPIGMTGCRLGASCPYSFIQPWALTVRAKLIRSIVPLILMFLPEALRYGPVPCVIVSVPP